MAHKWKLAMCSLALIAMVQWSACTSDQEVAREAVQKLFASKDELTSDEIAKKLQPFDQYFFEDEPEESIYVSRLIAQLEEPANIFCKNRGALRDMKTVLHTNDFRDRYPALHSYLKEAYNRQVERCEMEMKNTMDQFEKDYPKYNDIILTVAKNQDVDALGRMLIKDAIAHKMFSTPSSLRRTAERTIGDLEDACSSYMSRFGNLIYASFEIPNFMPSEIRKYRRLTAAYWRCKKVAKTVFESMIASELEAFRNKRETKWLRPSKQLNEHRLP